jgi:hypothetical protein
MYDTNQSMQHASSSWPFAAARTMFVTRTLTSAQEWIPEVPCTH